MIGDLLKQKNVLNRDIMKCLDEELSNLKQSADNMAECATNMRGQGYQTFIQSREDFIEKVKNLQKQFDDCCQ